MEKCFSVFARSSVRQSRDREHPRAWCVCVCIFFILGLSLPGISLSPFPPPPPLRFSHGRRTRRERFISTPVAIVPFVSQPALHASRRAFSSYLLYLSASYRLSFSPCHPLYHPCSSWQIRAVDESTRRYLDISANTRLMRDADVFIHRRTFPILTNNALYRTLLVWIPCCPHDISPATERRILFSREKNLARIKIN